MPQKIRKRYCIWVAHPISVLNKPRINSMNKMVLQNHSLEQDKSFRQLTKFRSWFCLTCAV